MGSFGDPVSRADALARLQVTDAYFEARRIEKLRLDPRRALASGLAQIVRRFASPDQPARGRTFLGHGFVGYLGDPVTWSVITTGAFERELTRALLMLIEPGSTLLDVGTQLGYYALLFAALCGPRGAVHCFDPATTTAGPWRTNLAGARNVERHNVAVGRTAGTARFREFQGSLSPFSSTRTPRLDTGIELPPGVERNVPVIALDAFCRERNLRPSLVKIDAEGAELEVLEGAREIMRAARPALSVEVGDVVDGAPSTRALIALLYEEGYDVWEPTRDGLVPHAPRTEPYGPGNLVFLPREFAQKSDSESE